MQIKKFNFDLIDFGSDPNTVVVANDPVQENLQEFGGPGQDVTEQNPQSPEGEIASEAPVVEEPAAPSFSEEEMEMAKKLAKEEGLREGEQAGIQKAKAEQDEKVAKELADVSRILQSLNGEIAKIEVQISEAAQKFEQESIALAFAVAKKASNVNLSEQSVQEIEEQVRQHLEKVTTTEKPKLIVHPGVADFLSDKLTSCEVVKDGELQVDDFKLDWSAGFAEKKIDSLWKEIAQILQMDEKFLERLREVDSLKEQITSLQEQNQIFKDTISQQAQPLKDLENGFAEEPKKEFEEVDLGGAQKVTEAAAQEVEQTQEESAEKPDEKNENEDINNSAEQTENGEEENKANETNEETNQNNKSEVEDE